LTIISAYDAAKNLAYDTTFDVDGDLTCVWMDQNYDWSNLVFRDRCGESLNLAVNYLVDVLHSLFPIAATVDVEPDAINLKSRGQWITAYIQLPEGYDAIDIDAVTILLNEIVSPVLDPKHGFVTNSNEYLVDHGGDGTLERMVKFNRAEVMALLSVGEATLTITGKVDGTPFEGTDTIRVINK
jgi:hypothetical protein